MSFVLDNSVALAWCFEDEQTAAILALLDRVAGLLQALPIRIYDETASRTWTVTAQLAEQHRLTAYDASYLELALRLDLPLATSDRPLLAAAQYAGVTLLPTR